jgi:hypothetical protein
MNIVEEWHSEMVSGGTKFERDVPSGVASLKDLISN